MWRIVKPLGLRIGLIGLLVLLALELSGVRTLFPDRPSATLGVVGVLALIALSVLLFKYGQSYAAERLNPRWQTVLRMLDDGVLLVNAKALVEWYNPTWAKIFQWPETPARSLRLREALHDPRIEDAFQAALTNGLSSEHQITVAAPDAHTFQLKIWALTPAGAGRPSGAVGVLIDISKAERQTQIWRDFLDNFLHEMRNPLTSILVSVEMLLEGRLGEPRHNLPFLQALQKQARRIQELIRGISALPAIESRAMRLEPRELDLKVIIDEMVSLATAQALAAGVSLFVECPADLKVLADRHGLEQILTNLVDNAIKFNRKGGAVRVSAWQKGEAAVIISVNDTGIGIASEERARIFDRFYRMDRGGAREPAGTGLGLAIVKQLVEALGGQVEVQSTPNLGSIFQVTLPAPPQEARMARGSW